MGLTTILDKRLKNTNQIPVETKDTLVSLVGTGLTFKNESIIDRTYPNE
jgi:hypothetical protein